MRTGGALAAASRLTELTTGSPFLVASALSTFAQSQPQPGGVPPLPSGEEPAYGLTNVQTFYVVQPMENLLFATADATEAYFPEHSLIVGADGSMRSTVEMNPGTVYTVVSSDTALSPSRLAKLAARAGLPATGRSCRPTSSSRRATTPGSLPSPAGS